jgi:hypothetical protein
MFKGVGYYHLKACIEEQNSKITLSGRKFAEYRGLEDAERIDNDPLLFYFSRKNKTFVVKKSLNHGSSGRTFFPYDFDPRRVNNLSHAPLLDLSL